MAITNQQRVGKTLDLLRDGLADFADREFTNKYKDQCLKEAQSYLATDRLRGGKQIKEWDVAALLRLMWESWNDVFRQTLGHSERTLVSELRSVRDKWAHQENFTSDDSDRAMDSAERLLAAISSPLSDQVRQMKQELRRLIYDEQVRGEKRKVGGSLIEVRASEGLKAWREVVTPHADVARGEYQQAEFAADLWQVHLGQGADEYLKPQEFFRRTFLTESLKKLLINGVKRLAGAGGDPVIQLQTNFGGGKTHSMLALYHLFSGAIPTELPGIEDVLAQAGVKSLSKAKRVVLVGNRISPGNPVVKKDGTIIRTLWGELAYQLGGKKAYLRIQADDEKATSPGDALRELLVEHGPCLILIDEWVAYARQLHDQSDLPAGGFETQFTFAQALTESAKVAGNCLLVISLPASDTSGSPHTQADDVEVGGVRGREALNRLRNVVGRVESSWRPATAEEGFEIVRRRLFEPLSGDQFKNRDVTARAFSDLYHAQASEFPQECRDHDYEKRIKAAYPIHPEIFDQLYGAWSTLIKFQRTRGVLRLMAAVIHSLWEKGDKSPLILPSTIPIDDPRVQGELTRYLSDNWVPIIEKDVDGPNSLPQKIDGEQSGTLGKLQATRRVARAIYMGSAPSSGLAHRGVEDRRIKLGCVMPGESPAVFGDGLRRLAATATYLYQDGTRFWYDTQPTVTKLAEDRTEQLKREPDKVFEELEQRIRTDIARTGEFYRVHAFPKNSSDIPDEPEARLVILPPEASFSKEADNSALGAALEIIEKRGTLPRIYRNSLVFLAADKTRLQDLDESLRKFISWDSILKEKDQLNLTPFQVKQAETQKTSANSSVMARLPEGYCWLLIPEQKNETKASISWQSIRQTGSDGLAIRASKKLKNDDLLISSLGPTILRKYLDEIPLWRGNHVDIRLLADDFSKFLYLPRLAKPETLFQSIRDGIAGLTWQTDGFAFAEAFDDSSKRYRGLRAGQVAPLVGDGGGLLVKSEIARHQLDKETPGLINDSLSTNLKDGEKGTLHPFGGDGSKQLQSAQVVRRFHASATLDPARVGRDASRIAEEVISHLVAQDGAEVKVTLEIEAQLPKGANDKLIRVVTENASSLKIDQHGFEKE